MAFSALTTAQIAASEPVKQELWTKVKDNFDDHETRVTTLEGSLQVFAPIEWRVFGAHWKTGSDTGLAFERITESITLTSGTLYIIDDGTSGTLTVDVQKSSSGGGSFSTIFSTKPTLAQGGGNHGTNNGVLSTTVLVSGDILRLDVSAYQVGNIEFYVQLEFTAT